MIPDCLSIYNKDISYERPVKKKSASSKFIYVGTHVFVLFGGERYYQYDIKLKTILKAVMDHHYWLRSITPSLVFSVRRPIPSLRKQRLHIKNYATFTTFK